MTMKIAVYTSVWGASSRAVRKDLKAPQHFSLERKYIPTSQSLSEHKVHNREIHFVKPMYLYDQDYKNVMFLLL